MTPSHRLVLSFLLLLAADSLRAQVSRIAGPIDSAKIVPMSGNLRPAALRRDDQGRVDPSFSLPGMTLYLQPSATQHADLLRLLDQQQDRSSPRYHQWLTPEEYADRFGLSAQDLAAAADWLRSRGFVVSKAARSRTWIAFSGTARQVEETFHTEIHRYVLNGKTHFANAMEPSIPLALAGAVAGLDGLDDLTTEQAEATSATGVHTLAPDDLAVIYDISFVYQSGIDGTGQKIAIAGASDFNASALADVAQFRTRFNLPAMVPQVIRDPTYPDPGIGNSVNEAHLDIEWVGAIARKAQIVFVYSNSFSHAVTYAIDNNLAPVVSMSANAGCEAVNTPANIAFYQGLAQQGNAQGITWVISGSDAASASCDANGANLPAVSGLAVRFPASIPEVTAVGGLEFDEAAAAGPFWSATNTANGASALSYIPEMVWNDAVALQALWGGGGGQSIYFAKPAWQTGPGVPNDQARDLPDVALAASFSHDGYTTINNQAVGTSGGTSASAPVFAGIVTLLNQYVVSKGIQSQPGLGNINPNLYRLAASENSPFHDITLGNNIIPCGVGTLNCPNGTMGFSAAPGYDLASGLGSVDVAKFLNAWSSAEPVLPAITPGGIVPATVQPGEWVSIYGTNLASGTTYWTGNFPTSLGGTSVTIDGKLAYLSYVSSGQINLQVPNDAATGVVSVVVTTASGSGSSTVTLAPFGPVFALLDSKHVAGIILRSNGTGAYGGGTYDIIGPTGSTLGYATVAAKAGDVIELFGTGFGPTNPAVPSGQAFSGAAPTTNTVTLHINSGSVAPFFSGLSGPGLYQFNLTVPSGLGTGDVPLQAIVGGVQTPAGVVISLQ